MKWIILLISAALLYQPLDSVEAPTQSDPSTTSSSLSQQQALDEQAPPEGYYAFVESPNAEPPRVRPPPYSHAPLDCREDDVKTPHVSPFNLCGDLNKGTIPRNPMGQNVLGSPYPFELIKNMTLKYLSRTLPILKADDTLPKVAQLQDDLISQNTISHTFNPNDRVKRDITPITPIPVAPKSNNPPPPAEDTTDNRQSRKFCDQGGVFCMLYKAINGDSSSSSSANQVVGSSHHHHQPLERRDDNAPPLATSSNNNNNNGGSGGGGQPRYEGPPTPCPAKVEYATPVFAKNYQGVWRYVVQIPYEGYFTQTLEVTRCLQSRCHYLDGGCLSSPRWSSLLVAEIYYPDTVLANPDSANNPPRSPVAASQPPSVQDFQNYQQYLHKRAGLQAGPAGDITTSKPASSGTGSTHCDGVDALGCFQVRLYYDWFLIPGSCKCWRPDYFNKYVRRKSTGADL